jgi:hypothetical protein
VREDLGFADVMSRVLVDRQVGAAATISRLITPSTEPTVMMTRGPRRSRMCPTRIPARAETTRPRENAPVVAPAGQPVAVMI